MAHLSNPLDLFVLGAALAGFVVFLAVHLLVFRYVQPRQMTRPLILSAATGFLTTSHAAAWLIGAQPFADYSPSARWLAGGVSLAIYSLTTLHYLSWVFGMHEAAVRMRILYELNRLTSKSATLNEIYSAYCDETILKIRLAKLTGAGYLVQDGQSYRIGRPMVFLQARVIHMLRVLLGMSQP